MRNLRDAVLTGVGMQTLGWDTSAAGDGLPLDLADAQRDERHSEWPEAGTVGRSAASSKVLAMAFADHTAAGLRSILAATIAPS